MLGTVTYNFWDLTPLQFIFLDKAKETFASKAVVFILNSGQFWSSYFVCSNIEKFEILFEQTCFPCGLIERGVYSSKILIETEKEFKFVCCLNSFQLKTLQSI